MFQYVTRFLIQINMIRKNQIKEFIENHFNVEDISIKLSNDTLTILRGYYCVLCYKYSTDITNTTELAKDLNIKQHGTIVNCMNKVYDGLEFDKRIKLEFGYLEKSFLECFPVPEFVSEFTSSKEIKLKREIINLRIKNRNLHAVKRSMMKKVEELKNIKEMFSL